MPSLAVPRKVVEALLLGPPEDRRQLQDSPILGDVWLAYGGDPASTQDLLITPHRAVVAATVAKTISASIERKGARIAYLQGLVAARLTFEEVLRILVPLTQWWHQRKVVEILLRDFSDPAVMPARLKEVYGSVLDALRAARTGSSRRPSGRMTALDRYIALAGLVLWAAGQKPTRARSEAAAVEEVLERAIRSVKKIASGLEDIFRQIADERTGGDDERLIFQVSLNRTVLPALENSVPAVKGDAARTLFKVKCDRIAWAVLDCGIDATHEAFQIPGGESGEHRVKETYDFSHIRDLVSADADELSDKEVEAMIASTGLSTKPKTARRHLERLAKDAEEGLPVNWGLVEEFVTLKAPPTPSNGHGTHVGGIIGARKPEDSDRTDGADGLCPDIWLYDFRVLSDTLEETEFAVVAALQFIRFINARHNHVTIHGANLSLSIPHSVRNFACGQTPVCLEAERLVDSGVVVVAAAGNFGYQRFETRDGLFEGYAAFSITDPGNSDSVITVGSTHGHAPHTYGVSFFSSRGPTGDGRAKPDLVAPGERIVAPLPGDDWGQESGTSMAAPHVSGAAAMLMARYPELIGQPRRIKRILCESATDLGRERSFQGSGLLDVLRAFQSI